MAQKKRMPRTSLGNCRNYASSLVYETNGARKAYVRPNCRAALRGSLASPLETLAGALAPAFVLCGRFLRPHRTRLAPEPHSVQAAGFQDARARAIHPHAARGQGEKGGLRWLGQTDLQARATGGRNGRLPRPAAAQVTSSGIACEPLGRRLGDGLKFYGPRFIRARKTRLAPEPHPVQAADFQDARARAIHPLAAESQGRNACGVLVGFLRRNGRPPRRAAARGLPLWGSLASPFGDHCRRPGAGLCSMRADFYARIEHGLHRSPTRCKPLVFRMPERERSSPRGPRKGAWACGGLTCGGRKGRLPRFTGRDLSSG